MDMWWDQLELYLFISIELFQDFMGFIIKIGQSWYEITLCQSFEYFLVVLCNCSVCSVFKIY